MGFEPTHVERNGLAVHRLNHSATSSQYSPVANNNYICLIFLLFDTILLHYSVRGGNLDEKSGFRCNIRVAIHITIVSGSVA